MYSIPENRLYQANRYNKDFKLSSSSLIKILGDKQNLGSGYYSSSIKRIIVEFHEKNLVFALKSFKKPQYVNNALQIYQKVKNAKLPTWNTYRHLGIWKERMIF